MPDDQKGSTEWRLIPDPSNPDRLELLRGPFLVANWILPGTGVEDLLKEAAEGRRVLALRGDLTNLSDEDAGSLLEKIFPTDAAELAETRDLVTSEAVKIVSAYLPTLGRLQAAAALLQAAAALHSAMAEATEHLEGGRDGE